MMDGHAASRSLEVGCLVQVDLFDVSIIDVTAPVALLVVVIIHQSFVAGLFNADCCITLR